MYTISALYQIVNLKATTQWLKAFRIKQGPFYNCGCINQLQSHDIFSVIYSPTK